MVCILLFVFVFFFCFLFLFFVIVVIVFVLSSGLVYLFDCFIMTLFRLPLYKKNSPGSRNCDNQRSFCPN